MKDKFTDITDSIRKFIENQNLFTDLEKKSVEELINTISIYHEELIFQNKELERRNLEIENYSREIFDLFQNAPVPYAVFDDNLRIIKHNIQFQNLIQKNQEEINNHYITDFISSISQDQFYLYLKQIEKGIKTNPIIVEFGPTNQNRKIQLQVELHKHIDQVQYRATFTDLTEIYNLQKQLEESKSYYQKIIHNSPHAIYDYTINEDNELIFNFYNSAADEILSMEHAPHIGKKIQDIFPRLKDSELLQQFKHIAKNGGILKINDYWYEDQNISGFYSLVAYQPIQNQIIIIFRDVTDEYLQKKQLEIENSISAGIVNNISISELLEQLKQEITKILDISNCYLLIYDNEKLDYSIQYQSNQFIDNKNLEIDKLLASIVKQHLQPTHLIKHEIEKILTHEKSYDSVLLPESWLGIPLIENKEFLGLIIIENYTKVPKYNNQIVNFLQTIANNISSFIQRKKIDKFVNILYRSVLNSPVSIIITDSNGLIEYVNPKCEEITGYKLEEIKHKKTSIFKSNHHDKAFYKNLWSTIKSGNIWEGKFLNRKKNGSLYWVEAKIAPVFDEKKQITNFVAIKEDITIKEQILQELKLSKTKAEESDRLKSAFLANMSHEIRTPLNAIMGFSSLLTDDDLTPEERKLYSKIINEKGNELLKIIEDILDLSKLEAKQVNIVKSLVSIPALFSELNKTFTLFLQKNPSKKIQLIFYEPEPPDLTILTDSSRIRQILDNLINNAIKFTNEGKIEVKCKLLDKQVLFSVSDTGIGISKENYNIIFEYFRQIEEDFARRKYGGVGLGLPIVKRLVELLDGEIWLESELGKGSTFYFTIKYNSVSK